MFIVQSFNSESKEWSNDDSSIHRGRNVNKGWDHGAHFVPPQSGARIISIKAQSPALQAIIKAAIREITGDALFSTAYPSVITVVNHFCNTLRTATNNLNFPTLGHRFQNDRRFAETISRVVSHPMSIILVLFLIFDHSCLSVCQTSVAT